MPVPGRQVLAQVPKTSGTWILYGSPGGSAPASAAKNLISTSFVGRPGTPVWTMTSRTCLASGYRPANSSGQLRRRRAHRDHDGKLAVALGKVRHQANGRRDDRQVGKHGLKDDQARTLRRAGHHKNVERVQRVADLVDGGRKDGVGRDRSDFIDDLLHILRPDVYGTERRA
jgi:hypothetical protein